jgi:prevent-host-death family protein
LSTRRVSTAQAKAKLSELIGAVAYGRERVLIERRGRPVAVLVSVEDAEQLGDRPPAGGQPRGALAMVGGWEEVGDDFIDDLVRDVYAAREADSGRPVDLEP